MKNFKRLLTFIIDWYLGSVFVQCAVLITNAIFSKNMFNDAGNIALQENANLLIILFYFLMSIIMLIIYYVVIPIKSNNQTLGMKLTKCKIIKTDNKNLDVKTLMLRNVIFFSFVQQVISPFSSPFQTLIKFIFNDTVATTLTIISAVFVLISLIDYLFVHHATLHDDLTKTTLIALPQETK